jgi:hypothetical protein
MNYGDKSIVRTVLVAGLVTCTAPGALAFTLFFNAAGAKPSPVLGGALQSGSPAPFWGEGRRG